MKKSAVTLLTFVLSCQFVLAADNTLSESEIADGWILLFDGKTHNGWTTSDSKPSQRPVENGSLNPHKCGAYMLVTERQWGDFILKLAFKQSPKCNSGVFFRVHSLEKQLGRDVGYNGLEVAIDDTQTAGFVDAGAIYDLSPPTKNALRPIGQWNELTLTSKGNRAVVELNGEVVNDVDFDKFSESGKRPDGTNHKFDAAFKNFPQYGRIGLQDHGGDIWFKNIKLLPLNSAQAPIALNDRLEIFVDTALIDRLEGARLHLHDPIDEGVAVPFDEPWEGAFSAYCTIIHDGDTYRLYYRGMPSSAGDGSAGETTCYAESRDGATWTKPKLDLFDVAGSKENNVILANAAPVTHNFSPFIDGRPGVPTPERFKALGGIADSGLIAYVSADGIHWKKLRDEPVFKFSGWVFDSQNVAFWSPTEAQYVLYFRKAVDGVRSISRTTSKDFLQWTEPVEMTYSDSNSPKPSQQLYTSQTHPYFRAPHIYLATAARFMPERQVLTDAEAQAIGVHPEYFKDTSDAVLMSSRAGSTQYDRTFLGALIRPGIGARNWVSRSNYPALNIVPTGPTEMSLYVNQDYGQPTAHLHRYSMRIDGLTSIRAPFEGGELVTVPVTFTGNELVINFATSAAGSVRVELQDADGAPIPGFALEEARELIGNEIERVVAWSGGSDVSALADKPLRLRFVLKDADLYSLRFRKAL